MSFVSPSPSAPNFSLISIEGALTAVFVGLAFAWPRLGSRSFALIESKFRRLAASRIRSVVVVGLAAILLRLAILPLDPVPGPILPDDFSNLLAADTFLHGRLANPTPPLWTHFETIHVSMVPNYVTMYFPAQGLVLAAGKILFGSPWFGVMLSGAIMCSALCWMLQGWLPAPWALLGGFLAVMRIGLFSYWTSTYHSAAPITAIGGALVLGALPRFRRRASMSHLFLMAAGAVILLLSRPYEGCLLCLAALAGLAYWLVTKQTPPLRSLVLRAVPALVLLVAGFVWLGYYDFQAFGSPFTLPYTLNRAAYATSPYFIWQHPRPEPHYRYAEMRSFYQREEVDLYDRIRSRPITMSLVKLTQMGRFFIGFALLPPLFLLPWAIGDRRIRFLVFATIVLAAGLAIQIFTWPYYIAPFTAAFYAIGLQSMRHLRLWKPGKQPAGLALTRWTVALCVLLVGARAFDKQLGCSVPQSSMGTWVLNWFGPDHYVTQRSIVEGRLNSLPGGQLAIVRYAPAHDPIDEWVYNSADIDGSKVIWARAMDDGNDLELLHYYRDRKAWLVQPDSPGAELVPYPSAEQAAATPAR